MLCSAAADVVLEGAQWPVSDFEDSGGLTSGRWDKLSPGATVRVEYFLTPKASGPYQALAAKVTYKAETGAKPQVMLRLSTLKCMLNLIAVIEVDMKARVPRADCIWCNTCPLHSVANSEAFADSFECGKPHLLRYALAVCCAIQPASICNRYA